MPYKPKHPCAHPGCPNLTSERYCDEHKLVEQKKYNRFCRSKDINKKYGRSWKKVRERYIATHPLCEECLKQGRMVPVQEVHHIVPVSRGGTNSENNLMSLCRSCHNRKHIELGDR